MGAEKLDEQSFIKKLDEIPSLPAIVYELSRVINDPMSSTSEVEAIMNQDLGMTTQVLKLANSAYYAIPGGVTNLSRAIGFIGFDTIHQLVLSASIIQTLSTDNEPRFNMPEFWKHSVAVGMAAETIAKYLRLPNAGDFFTAGLIHDIGKVALFIVGPDHLAEILNLTAQKNISYHQAELELGEIPHTEISRMLGEKWRLPKVMLASCLYHHEKDISKRSALSQDLNQTVDIIFLGNILAHAMKFGFSGHKFVTGVPNEILQRLRLDAQKDMPALLKQIKQNLDQAGGFIQAIVGNP